MLDCIAVKFSVFTCMLLVLCDIIRLKLFCRMQGTRHACCVVAILSLFLCAFAISAESNDSRVLFVPKAEFVQVISGIMRPKDGDKLVEQNSNNSKEDFSPFGKMNRVKRDSFFHLQKTLESRNHYDSSHRASYSPRNSQNSSLRFRGSSEHSDNDYLGVKA